MILSFGVALNEAAWQGVIEGLGVAAKFEIYGNTQPAHGVAPGAAPLAVCLLATPAGHTSSGYLVFDAADPLGTVILVSGQATWGRLVDGGGAVWAQFDVSGPSGNGALKVSIAGLEEGEPENQMYEGGTFTLGLTRLTLLTPG